MTLSLADPMRGAAPERALEGVAWLLQLAIIGYAVAGALAGPAPFSRAALVGPLALPPVAYLWHDLPSGRWVASKGGSCPLVLGYLLQVTWLVSVLHEHAPAVAGPDTPLVALGLPYVVIGVLRGRPHHVAGRAAFALLPILPAWFICRTWSADPGVGLDLVLPHLLAVALGSVVVTTLGAIGLEQIRRDRENQGAAVERHAVTTERSRIANARRWAERLDEVLGRPAGGAKADGPILVGGAQPPAPVDVNMLLRRAQAQRGSLGTFVSYNGGADLSKVYLVPGEAGRALRTLIDEVVVPEPGHVEIVCSLDDETTLRVGFAGPFAGLSAGADPRYRRSRRGVRWHWIRLTLLEPAERQGQAPRLVRHYRRYGAYPFIGRGVVIGGALSAIVALCRLIAHGHRATTLLLAASMVAVSLRRAYVAWRHPERLLEVALLVRWLVVSSLLVTLLIVSLPDDARFFCTPRCPQPLAFQVLGAALLLFMAVANGRIMAAVAGATTLLFAGLGYVGGFGRAARGTPALPTVLWWPFWTAVGAALAVVLRYAIHEASCVVDCRLRERCAAAVAAYRQRELSLWADEPGTSLTPEAVSSAEHLERWINDHGGAGARVVDCDVAPADQGSPAERAWVARMLRAGLVDGDDRAEREVRIAITPGRVAVEVSGPGAARWSSEAWAAADGYTRALGGQLADGGGIGGSIPRLLNRETL